LRGQQRLCFLRNAPLSRFIAIQRTWNRDTLNEGRIIQNPGECKSKNERSFFPEQSYEYRQGCTGDKGDVPTISSYP